MIRQRLSSFHRLAARAAFVVALGTWPVVAAAEAPPDSREPNGPSRTLTLWQAVDLARTRAPRVHAAFARIASAQAGVDRSSAAHLPTISAQGAGTAFTTNGQIYSAGLVSSASTDTYLLAQGTLGLQWTLYDFGHTSSAIDASKAGVTAADLSARESEQRAMAEAAVAFYALLADDALIASAREMRAERERVMDITHRLVQSGFRTQVDDTRAQVALDIAQLDLTSAEAARDNDSVTLASALLLDPTTTFRLQAPPPFGPAAGTAHVDVVQARREVAAAAARVDQARHEVTTAHRAHLPVLAANVSGSLLYVRDRSTFQGVAVNSTGPTELAQGGLVLTVPLYDPLLNANVRWAEANLGEAQASLEQVTQDARSEASRASRQVRNASLLLDQATRLGAAATATLNSIEERYASGIEGPIVLIDAQREDALARVAIVRARLALDVARVRELEAASRVDDLRHAN